MWKIPIGENKGILPHEKEIYLLPANIFLANLEIALVNVMNHETILKFKVIS